MAKKLTYEELEQRVKKLEKKVEEHKPLEEALRESEEKYRNLVERANDGIAIIQDGMLKYVNSRLAEMAGYTVGEVIDTSFTKYIDPDEIPEAVDYYKRRMAGEQLPARYERGIRHKNGSRIDTEVSGGIITYQDKPADLVIIRDITNRKRAEQALKKSSEQIKLFAYSVSHDLRTPAIGIYGLTKLLLKHYGGILDEKAKNYCDQILEAANQIAILVGNINVYISSKEIPLNIESVRPTEILQMVRDEFSAQLDIRQIKWLQPESIPEIKADRVSMLRILRNVVDNALKYGGDDLSEVRIGYQRTDEFHILSVSDDGVGVKGENAEKIFEVFQRYETSGGVEGTGLGLAIVKELAEQHKGRVWVEAGRKKGATFYICVSRYL